MFQLFFTLTFSFFISVGRWGGGLVKGAFFFLLIMSYQKKKKSHIATLLLLYILTIAMCMSIIIYKDSQTVEGLSWHKTRHSVKYNHNNNAYTFMIFTV